MTTFFLITFWVGFGLTLVSAVLGAVDLSGGGDVGGDIGGADLSGDLSGAHVSGDMSGAHGGHGGDLAHGHGHGHGHISTVSPINFQTLVAFCMGFGGVGYIASRGGLVFWLAAIPLGVAGGLTTGWVIFRFMRFLVKGETPLPPTSYVGLVGKLTVGIREGGTGEMVYTQHGSRMVSAARSVAGTAIARGEQVLVLRYEKGVAYVEPWRDPMPEDRQIER